MVATGVDDVVSVGAGRREAGAAARVNGVVAKPAALPTASTAKLPAGPAGTVNVAAAVPAAVPAAEVTIPVATVREEPGAVWGRNASPTANGPSNSWSGFGLSLKAGAPVRNHGATEHNRPVVRLRWTDRDVEVTALAAS